MNPAIATSQTSQAAAPSLHSNGYKVIEMTFFYNDQPTEIRTEHALVDRLHDRELQDDDGDEREYHFNGYSLMESEIFYTFAHDEDVLGNKGEFTVTKYFTLDENP